MKYRINIKTNELIQDNNNLGDFFYTQDWREATQEEIANYLVKQAKDNKINELSQFYSSNECWLYTVYTDIKQYASYTKEADFFAKLLPACAGRTIQVFTDNNVVIQYNLTVEKASNLNYQINAVNGLMLKAKKIDIENRINLASNIDDINNIDFKKELLEAVIRQINLDLIK